MANKYPLKSRAQRWDIFCRVVDNMGDIGVCWRLSRLLVVVHGVAVRLWVDDATALARLCPTLILRGDIGVHEGVEIRLWRTPFAQTVEVTEVADVVIEAFACELPAAYTHAMAARVPAPVWINLDYLSAEQWVSDCHLMCSPHPRLGLRKYFFFPGFTPATGGLLREPGLFDQRDQYRADTAARSSFVARYVGAAVPQQALIVSLFSYAQAQLAALVQAWSCGDRDIVVLVPKSVALADVCRCFGLTHLPVGEQVSMGRVTVVALPFLSQLDYDRLLWSCDLNFVRGEDSFVRAQWAAVPFVWHIYQQADDAHGVKLDAFLTRFERGLSAADARACRQFWLAWNGAADVAGDMAGDMAVHWPALLAALPALAVHGRQWAAQLAGTEDLTSKLIKFCTDTVK